MTEYTPQDIVDIFLQKEKRVSAKLRTLDAQTIKPKKFELTNFFNFRNILKKPYGHDFEDRALGQAINELELLGFDHIQRDRLMETFADFPLLNYWQASLAGGVPYREASESFQEIEVGLQYHIGLKVVWFMDEDIKVKVMEALERMVEQQFLKELENIQKRSPGIFSVNRGEERPALQT